MSRYSVPDHYNIVDIDIRTNVDSSAAIHTDPMEVGLLERGIEGCAILEELQSEIKHGC